ncbi:MAG: VOC family protein, partial [Flavobacteriales bacterium]|nr:VOC family protein [Flavobacteriales bacterium]
MKKLEHIGIAVLDLEAAEKIFSDVLGEIPYKREVVDSESVLTSFFQAGESKIELLQSTSADGPIARHILKRGEGLHHLAFQVDDLDAEITELEAKGYR